MSLFAPKKDPASQEILKQLEKLSREVAKLKGERDGHKTAQQLEAELTTIKRDLTDKQIEYDREKEKWDREKRDVEHMVGLQRRRGKFETEAAGREAVLTVREENLAADKARFDEQVKFIEKRFEDQFESLNSLLEKVMERMPTTRQLITVNGGRDTGDETDG